MADDPETVGGKLRVSQAGLVIEHRRRLSRRPPALPGSSGSCSRPSRILVTEPREGDCKSPSLEVWVSLNIMGGGAVLIAAR